MFRTALKGVLFRKRRLVTTALAVALGVAFMTGTLVLTATMGRTFDNLFADVYKDIDAVVRANKAFDAPMGEGAQRGMVDASLVDTVRRVDGVQVAEGTVFGFARLVGKNGDPIGNPAMGAPTLGGNWSDTAELNPFEIVDGQPPRADDEVVIDRKSATDGNLAVGDTTIVLVQGPPQSVRISGIAKFGTVDSPGGASYVLFTTPVAQRLIGAPGRFTSIDTVADPGVSQAELVRRIEPVLPPTAEVLTGQQITEESQTEIRQGLSFFTTFLLVFAVVALLVGGFYIYNTFAITVAQRTRENGLLRALGASRRQVLFSVIFEALAIGVVASLVGVVAGVFVASGLKAMLSGLGFELPAGGVVFTPGTVLTALVVGVGVTVVASLSPARHAAKVPPIAAMRQASTSSSGYGSRQRMIIGTGLLVLGVALLFFGLFGDVSNGLSAVGGGAVLVFFAMSTLGRTVALPLSRVLGAPLPRFKGATGTLARENAMRNPRRTAATASALMIGVGLVAFITILASSTKASIDAALDRAFTGDFVIDSGSGFQGGLDPSLATRLNLLPEVAAATGLRTVPARVGEGVTRIGGVDRATAFEIFDVQPRQGTPADLGPGQIAVFEDVAKDKGRELGDPVPVLFRDTGEQTLRVALIYGESQPLGDYFVSYETYDANVAAVYDAQVMVKKAPDVPEASALAAIEQVARDYPGAEVQNQTQFKEAQAAQVNQLLFLVYALLALAILIALLGIANTLALSIFERIHELGLLRAVGMTRAQLRSTIRWESVIIALQGTVLGLVIGLLFGWSLVTALADEGIDTFRIPFGSLAVVVVLAGLAGVLAAVLPSRRAARLNVLAAISTE